MQGILFGTTPVMNAPAARAERDAAVQRVAEHAAPEFAQAADAAIYCAAKFNAELIVDDVWPFVPPHVRTQDARAMGAAMLRAVKAGWLEKTDRFRPSSQVQCHSNPRRVWRSLLF